MVNYVKYYNIDLPYSLLKSPNAKIYEYDKVKMFYNLYIEHFVVLMCDIFGYTRDGLYELKVVDNVSNKPFTKFNKDPFLLSYKEDKKLAEDIIKNGIYFPFAKNGDICIHGSHRLLSLNVYEHDVKNDFLIIDIGDMHDKFIKRDIELFDNPIKVRIPSDILYLNFSKEFKQKDIKQHKVLDDGVIECDCYSLQDVYDLYKTNAEWLRDLIFIHRKRGNILKGHDIVNNINHLH